MTQQKRKDIFNDRIMESSKKNYELLLKENKKLREQNKRLSSERLAMNPQAVQFFQPLEEKTYSFSGSSQETSISRLTRMIDGFKSSENELVSFLLSISEICMKSLVCH